MQGQRVVFTGTRQAAWEAFAVPDRPGPHEVLVRTRWSAVSAGTETAVYAGTHSGFRTPGAAYPRYPFYPGYSATGTVVAVGDAVRGLAPGQGVFLPGGHSSHLLWDTREPQFAPLPAGLPPDIGAFARLGTISLNGVRLAELSLGVTVAVLGAGLIGQLAAQLARLAGARPVVVVDRLGQRLEAARRCGLREVIDAATHDVLEAGRAQTGGRGFDVVIEATGAPAAIAQALALTAEYGRVVLLGSPRGRVEIDPYTHLHRPGITLVGAHERVTPRAASIHTRWTQQRNLELVLALLARGELAVEPLISHRLPAVRATEIHAALMRAPEDYLGVVLDWGAPDPPT